MGGPEGFGVLVLLPRDLIHPDPAEAARGPGAKRANALPLEPMSNEAMPGWIGRTVAPSQRVEH
jgi:hypothetical protein